MRGDQSRSHHEWNWCNRASWYFQVQEVLDIEQKALDTVSTDQYSFNRFMMALSPTIFSSIHWFCSTNTLWNCWHSAERSHKSYIWADLTIWKCAAGPPKLVKPRCQLSFSISRNPLYPNNPRAFLWSIDIFTNERKDYYWLAMYKNDSKINNMWRTWVNTKVEIEGQLPTYIYMTSSFHITFVVVFDITLSDQCMSFSVPW